MHALIHSNREKLNAERNELARWNVNLSANKTIKSKILCVFQHYFGCSCAVIACNYNLKNMPPPPSLPHQLSHTCVHFTCLNNLPTCYLFVPMQFPSWPCVMFSLALKKKIPPFWMRFHFEWSAALM